MGSMLKKTNLHGGFLALAGLMLATRFHHFGSAFSLPDASLIVFFLGGRFFNRLPPFVFLLCEAAAIDYVAITQFGVSDFCVSPAYVALVPAYGAMWLAGNYCKLNRSGLSAQFIILFLATSAAFLISNGSFFLFSGRYPNADFAVYLSRVAMYYPPYLSATLIYGLVIGAGIKVVHHLMADTEASGNIVH